MKNKLTLLLIFFVFGLCFISTGLAQEDFQLYYKAKKLMHQREYENALDTFNQLSTNYPDSKYLDDTEFWCGYILEKQGKYSTSFEKYQQLHTKYPDSPWVDDAEVQQIGIAEKMAHQGDHVYTNYLVQKLNSSDKTIRYQASVSLGKLRDPRALPGLKQMANNGDQDMSRMAKSLIDKIESKKPQPTPSSRIINKPTSIDSKREIKDRKTKPTIKRSPDKGPSTIKQPPRPKVQTPKQKPPATKSSKPKPIRNKK